MANASYQFLPWVRRGLSALIDTVDGASPLPARAKLKAELVVTSSDGPLPPAGIDTTLYGPGDIIGIDPRLIVRLEPRSQTANFEPNHLAGIEFDPPDFPWMFTPASAADATSSQGSSKLRPWVVLIVLDQSVVPGPKMTGGPLPTVKIPSTASGTELPDLIESWAWAHSQIVSDSVADPRKIDDDAAEKNPTHNLSRLICPRFLKPETSYVACLVPAFDRGVVRGLGVAPDPNVNTLQPAWKSPNPGDVILPVYFSWEFRTGAAGDFETLCRKIKPTVCPGDVGQTRMDLQMAGDQLNEPAGLAADPARDYQQHAMHVQGALRNRLLSPQTLPQVSDFLQQGLTKRLNQPALLGKTDPGVDPNTTPALGPAIYGEWHVNRHSLDNTAPAWFTQLNLDPRQRVSASVGAAVCQENQEDFMQSAWEQVGNVLEANRLLNFAALAKEAGASLLRRTIAKLPDDRLLQLASPALSRIRLNNVAQTVRAAVSITSLPDAAVEGALRRFLSPQRSMFRSVMARANLGQFQSGLVSSLAAGRADVDPRRATLDGISGIRGIESVAPNPSGRTALTAIGLPIELPSETLKSIQQDRGALAGRDFNRQPVRATVRDDLAVRGVLTQDHFDAIRDGLASLAQTNADVHATLGQVASAITTHAASIADNPIVLVPSGATIELGVLRADLPNRSISLTMLNSGQTTKILEFSATAAASITAENWKQRIVAMKVLPTQALRVSAAVVNVGASGGLELPDRLRVITPIRIRLAAGRIGGLAHPGPIAHPPAAPPTAPVPAPSIDKLPGHLLPPMVHLAGMITAVSKGVAKLDADQTYAIDTAKVVPFAMQSAAQAIRTRIDPTIVIPARLKDRLQTVGGASLLGRARVDLEIAGILMTQNQDRIMAAPELPAHTFLYLAMLDKERLLPGIGQLSDPNMMTMLETNPQFVESFLVGLNYEFNREMLWRSYPTDRRCTAFNRFWPWVDPSVKDIPPIHLWSPQSPLGSNSKGPSTEGKIVLLFRGELFRRYPNTVVMAWKAQINGAKRQLVDITGMSDPDIKMNVRNAAFAGRFDPDFSFVGLDLTSRELDDAGPTGWFIILQEQPTEPRFGFEDPPTPRSVPDNTKWPDVTWAQTGTAPGNYLRIGPDQDLVRDKHYNGVTITVDSANLAVAMLRKQFRMTIHSSHLDSLRHSN